MKKKVIIFYVLMILSQISVYSQEIIPDSIKLKLKSSLLSLDKNNPVKIFSPQVEAMRQFGSYPTNFSTGLVDITIPLYEIKSGDIELPIELKFHASGLKATEREGVLGVRWLLASGGCISRTIKGYPDEVLPFKKITSEDYEPDFLTLFGGSQYAGFHSDNLYFKNHLIDNKLYHGEYKDTEYDIFSYTLPNGESGNFIMTDNNGTKEPLTLPYRPFKFENIGGEIEIISESGISYKFGGKFSEDIDSPIGDGNSVTGVWYLSSMISANKQDTITFSYGGYTSPSLMTDYVSVYDKYSNLYTTNNNNINFKETLRRYFDFLDHPYEQDYHYSNSSFNTLKEIKFRHGVVKFNYTKLNTILDNIEILNTKKEVILKYKFVTEKNKSGNLTFLKSVISIDPENSNMANYLYDFDYYDYDNSHDAPAISTGELSLHRDRWGFFAKNNKGLTSDFITFYTGTLDNPTKSIKGSINMDPDEESTKLGMIKSIVYPTGGKSIFEYELNKYKDTRTEKMINIGGLRIKKQTNISKDNQPEIKTYKYENEVVAPYVKPLDNVESRRNYFTEDKILIFYKECNNLGTPCVSTISNEAQIYHRNYTGTIPEEYTEYAPLICYNTITETIENNGKIIYSYERDILPSVEKYPENKYEFLYNTNNNHIIFTNFWKSKKLWAQAYYKEAEEAPHKYVVYDYKPYVIKEIYDMYIHPYLRIFTVDETTARNSFENDKKVFERFRDIEPFYYIIQTHHIGDDLLMEKIEYVIIEGQKNEKRTVYSYDANLLLLNKVTTTNSNKAVYTEEYKYPFDYPEDNLDYSDLVNRNIISSPIEEIRYNGNKEIYRLKKNYLFDIWHTRKSQLKSVAESFSGENNLKEIESYQTFDRFENPVECTNKDGIKIIYIWSNEGKVVAEIKNATREQLVKALNGTYPESLSSPEGEPDYKTLAGLHTSTELKDALITTYTYKPLVGMTSMTDPRGVTTTYEYDSFGRLSKAKDANGKVIQSYDYHYQNQ